MTRKGGWDLEAHPGASLTCCVTVGKFIAVSQAPFPPAPLCAVAS